MKSLGWPDSHHLSAAEGWLELGNHLEVDAEVDKISPTLRTHPAVLRLRWHIRGQANRWNEALEVAEALVRLLPGNAESWLHRSVALHKLERTREARDQLLPAVPLFPDGDAIRYDLACYECQLGHLPEAKAWLEKAFAIDHTKSLKLEALKDPDLESLWKHIGEL